jgi:hypothetical protein
MRARTTVARALAAAIALLALLAPTPAHACAVCGAGDPTLTLMGSEKPFDGRLRISGDFRLGRVWAGAPAEDDIQLDEERLELAAAYAPTRTLFLSIAVPLLHRIATYHDGTTTAAFTIGDVQLRVKKFVWSGRRGAFVHQAAIQGGVDTPTSPLEYGEHDVALPAVLQPGMGAVSPFVGVFYGFTRGPWSFYTSAVVYLPFAVRDGPHASDSFKTSASVQRQIGRVFASRLGVDTRLDGSCEAYGKPDPNSGGFVAYLSPEMVVSPVTDLLLIAGVRVPAVQAFHGYHHEATIAGLGVTYDF